MNTENLKRIKVADNFYLDEFIDPVTYFTDEDNGRSRIDERLFDIVQLLRAKHGSSININGWWKHLKPYFDKPQNKLKTIHDFSKYCTSAKVAQWSGFRSKECKIGASKSAHKLGKAIDPKGSGKTLMQIVKDNKDEFYALGLRRLEDVKLTPTWLHMDTETRNERSNTIRIIDYTKETGSF